VEASTDRKVAKQLIQAGELYICKVGRWRQRWELLAVNIRDLEAAHSPKKAPPPSDEPVSPQALRAGR
jgi:hypothetical protein